MKKKKAFTLVELLAVIVILAIILLIAVPNVMKIISNTKINAYNRQLDMLKNITSKYVASYKIPVVEDLNISLKELYDNNMVSDVKDPRCGKNFKENETIITVTRISDIQLSYSINPETWCEGDATPPIINNINATSTSNSITVVVNATEDSGNIKKYYYSNDNGSNYIETTNATYTFSNLNKDTNYEIKVMVENEAKLKTTSESINVKTLNIEGALLTINPSGDVWAKEKTITITYPSDKGSLIYSYTLDGLTYTEISGNTYTYKFTDNGSIQARITDGTNTIDTTQSVIKIDNTPPILNIGNDESINNTVTSYNLMNGVSSSDNSNEPVNITYTGTIKFGTAGNYNIIYTATDKAGNTITKTKVITVNPLKAIYSRYTVNASKYQIYYWNNEVNYCNFMCWDGYKSGYTGYEIKTKTIAGKQTQYFSPTGSYKTISTGSAGSVYVISETSMVHYYNSKSSNSDGYAPLTVDYKMTLKEDGTEYTKGSFITTIITNPGTYPYNGRHSDGYWYMFSQNL